MKPTREEAFEAFCLLIAYATEQRTELATTAPDELVLFTRIGLENFGIEYNPALRAAQNGTLRTVRQGRRRLTTRAWVLAYIRSLPPAVARVDPGDDLLVTACKERARREARKEEGYRMHVEDGWTPTQIAKHFGLATATVEKWIEIVPRDAARRARRKARASTRP